ncbi:MAG: hypothetical protein HC813_01715 [Planctomycetes bacterium]|nr:hypothetical protein [Planctomycetota bacterium]
MSTFRDKEAWTGLYQTLLRQSRLDEFQALCGRVLSGDFLTPYRNERSHVHVLRGMAFETDGKLHEALSDYEKAIGANAGAWEALNNAAWHIAQLAPTRVEVARGYIEKALELRPEDATVLDTAAEVFSVSGETDRALTLIDAALAKVAADRLPKFTLHKAMILRRADRKTEMEAVLKGLVASHPDDPAGKRAREILWDMEEQLRMAEQAKRDAEERAAREAASPPEDSGE